MKKMKALAILLGVMVFLGCQEDEPELQTIVAPSNLQVSADIVGASAENPFGDGSGVVHFTATADNAVSYQFVYNGAVIASPSGQASYTFSSLGVNTYTLAVVAVGAGGLSSSEFTEVEVFASYEPPADLLQMLFGDGSRTWRIKSESPGHFGLGPVGGQTPTEWYGASPDEKVGTGMYDDRYIFNADGTITYITDNTNDGDGENPEGTVFGRENLINELDGEKADLETQGADVLNYPLNDYSGNWALIAPGGVETLTLTGTGFFGYYIGGNHEYEIFSRSATEMILRSTDGNSEFDWWFILTNEEPGAVGEEEEVIESIFDTLAFSDEFDVAGAPDSNVWNYELGDGCPNLCGWGNDEQQYYTDRPENVIVEDGVLKITARTEDFMTSAYTSTRLTSYQKYEFTYGRVEIRAKLPSGGGTWPALWLLGADYETNAWPAAGEIDIMEHVGNNLDQVLATTHDPDNFGGGGRSGSTTVAGATEDFHVYGMEWREDEIIFYVDDVVYHKVTNDATLPFNKDFFFIFNIAMGGTLGGTIDSGFVEDTMEVDYVRVYQ